MNRFDTSQVGGHPLTLADFNFIQNTYKDAITGITKAFGADSYILSGCIKSLQSTGVWAISEGYIVIQGEVCYVPDHTVSFISASDPLYWSIEESSIPPSPVNYRLTGATNVHFKRVGRVTTIASSIPFNLPTISRLIDISQRSEAFSLSIINGWNGKIYGQVTHGYFYLFGQIHASSRAIMQTPFIDIPSHLTPPLLTSNGYYGSTPAKNTNLALAELSATSSRYIIGSAQYFQSSNIIKEGSILIQSDFEISDEGYAFLLSPPPRTLKLQILETPPLQATYATVTIGIGSVSWPVEP